MSFFSVTASWSGKFFELHQSYIIFIVAVRQIIFNMVIVETVYPPSIVSFWIRTVWPY